MKPKYVLACLCDQICGVQRVNRHTDRKVKTEGSEVMYTNLLSSNVFFYWRYKILIWNWCKRLSFFWLNLNFFLQLIWPFVLSANPAWAQLRVLAGNICIWIEGVYEIYWYQLQKEFYMWHWKLITHLI